MKRLAILTQSFFLVVALSACSHAGGALPSGGIQASGSRREIPDVFAAARGMALSPSDYDAYIGPGVMGADRELARQIMGYMPANQRGDFVYVFPSGRLLSNNPAILRYMHLTAETPPNDISRPVPVIGGRQPLSVGRPATIRPQNYSSACSPPDPGTGGPYVRQVSQCAATAGFSFVNVQCGSYYFASGDQGNLYMEITNNSVNNSGSQALFEGGLQFNASGTIQPYAAQSPGGNLTSHLTNSNVYYSCGTDMVIVSGITWDSLMTFTEIGIVPPSCVPEYQFCAGQIFTPQNAAWMFYPSPFGSTPGYDAGMGENTPCTNCSISRVTTLAQSSEQYVVGYNLDGSYFGVNPSGGTAIHWMQTAYGHWETDCVPGTTLCTGHYPIDPSTNYGGPQPYPSGCCVASYISGIPGLGPYESWDGIDMVSTSAALKAGAFAEPIPPLPCTLDALGYCADYTYKDTTGKCLLHGRPETYRTFTWSDVKSYRVYKQTYPRWTGSATHTITWGPPTPLCKDPQTVTSDVWSPYEPKIQFNDPNLP